MTMQYQATVDNQWYDQGEGPNSLAKPESSSILLNWREKKPDNDPVNHPEHYTSHASGIECIQITEHMGFCTGNAIKYIWRADLKDNAIEDLQKAKWYIDKEISKRQAQGSA